MASQSKPSRCPAKAGGRANQASLRVLIVEDDALIAMAAEQILEEAGHQVVGWADRCRTAVDMVEAERPDLVVMDISLAGNRDGVDAAIIIRRRYGTPAVFVSAERRRDVLARAQEAEPAGWVVKPFDGRELVAAINAASCTG
jgi:two-component system, response regulator PdtaR